MHDVLPFPEDVAMYGDAARRRRAVAEHTPWPYLDAEANQVLRYLLLGLSHREIALLLGVSRTTAARRARALAPLAAQLLGETR